MTGAGFVRDAHAPQAGKVLGLRRRLTLRSKVEARSAGRSHKPRNLAKSVTVE